MNVKTVRYDSPTAAREFMQSLRETGFAVLTAHPIEKELIDGTFGEWEGFFASPEKHEHLFEPAIQAGYFPFKSENAKGAPAKDLKEFYHYYPARKRLPERADRRTPELYKRLVGLGAELLSWIEEETPAEVRSRFLMPLARMIEKSDETLLRILHYPPLKPEDFREGAVRAAAHEDINLITLLPAATAPGLEVRDVNGRWHAVPCDPGMIVVNAGDMLQEASHRFYPSTTHQVVNPPLSEAAKPRYSMPLFLHARRDAPLTTTRTAGQYLDERLREIGLKK